MTRPNLNAIAMVPPELDGAIGSTKITSSGRARTCCRNCSTTEFSHASSIGAMSELVQGALYPAVRPKDIRAFDLPVPELDEQRRIVAEIEKQFSRLDEAVANLKRVKANLKRYKAAVLKAAVEGRLVPTEAELARREGRSYETGEQLLHRTLEARRNRYSTESSGRYAEPAGPDTAHLPRLAEGSIWASAEQVSDFITKGTTPAATKLSSGAGRVVNSSRSPTSPSTIARQRLQACICRSAAHAGDSRDRRSGRATF